MKINEKLYDKVYTQKINFTITPSGGTTTLGTGDTMVDISSLGAKKILGLTLLTSFDFSVLQVQTDLTTNPSSIRVLCYRLNGKYTSAINYSMIVMYTK